MDPTPEKEDPDVKPPSRGTADESSEDRRFWGLDDEEDEVPAARGKSAPAPEPDPLDEDLDDPEDDAGTTASRVGPPADPDAPVGWARFKVSRKDVLWLGALGVFLLILVSYAIGIFFSNINTVGRPDGVDFPVKGTKVVIGKILTYWRKPDREADRVKLEARLIPCADITLKSGSGRGRLRVFFENEEGNFVGDPVSLDFTDGVFADSGTPQAVINATDGFEHEGQYNNYIAEQVKFWYVNVFEGPAPDVEDGEFKEILRLRISPKRR
jgi:hypothetical protein